MEMLARIASLREIVKKTEKLLEETREEVLSGEGTITKF